MATRRLETLQAAGERQPRDCRPPQTHHIRAQLHAVLGYTELILKKNQGSLG